MINENIDTFFFPLFQLYSEGSFVYTEAGEGLAEAFGSEDETLSGFLSKALLRRNMLLSVVLLALWIGFWLLVVSRLDKQKKEKEKEKERAIYHDGKKTK